LPNGVELHDGNLVMRIVALRDDVIRIRAGISQLPEDASWAVLPESRTSSVQVTPSSDSTAIGFRTASLQVTVDRDSGLMAVQDLSGHLLQQDAEPLRFDDHQFTLTRAMPQDEHYFGLGDRPGPLDRRGHAFTLWNTDAYRFQESTDPIYKAIPFFLTYRAGIATGVFLDNTWRSSFDFGKASPSTYSFGAVGGPVDYYIFGGTSPREAVETYAWLTGKPPLPPLWMFGFQQSRYTYTPEARLMEVATRLRSDHIPADALYLDIGFQDRNRPFTSNLTTFPNLPADLAKLRDMHFHVVAITDLHIAKAPQQGYAPYDSGIAGNHFLHNPDGTVYVGSVWPGPSAFPDFTQASTRAWWGTLYTHFTQIGFSGFWNDMSEPSIFNVPPARCRLIPFIASTSPVLLPAPRPTQSCTTSTAWRTPAPPTKACSSCSRTRVPSCSRAPPTQAASAMP
jgi:alpha-glucosidase